jgi:hypothetical protein
VGTELVEHDDLLAGQVVDESLLRCGRDFAERELEDVLVFANVL